MSVADVRTAIVACLAAVPEVGVVHPYERYAADQARLRQLYFSEPHNQVRGWYVRRLVTRETGRIRDRSVEVIRWRIAGVMTLNDAEASELTFDALIEAARDAFRADDTLGGTVQECGLPQEDGGTGEAGLQLDDCGPAMFGGVLVHACRLGLNTLRFL